MHSNIWRLSLVLMALSVSIDQIVAQENQKNDVDKPAVNQTAQSLNVGAGDNKTKMHYWLFVPSEYSVDADKKWPLMVFLHGMGERGPVDGSNLAIVKKWGPPRLVAKKPDFPFVLVSPHVRRSRAVDAVAPPSPESRFIPST